MISLLKTHHVMKFTLARIFLSNLNLFLFEMYNKSFHDNALFTTTKKRFKFK